MNEKQLNQIEEWLSGQKPYKLLDCSRRAFLKLKGARLHVWLALYTREDDDQQSWLSLERLMADTGCSKHTVIDARRWLVENGWIRVLDGSAADKYSNPSQGAHSVRIFCVDDPTKGAETALGGKETLPGSGGVQKLHVQELGAEIAPKACSCSCPCSCIEVEVELTTDTKVKTGAGSMSVQPSPSGTTSLRDDEKQKPKQKTLASAAKWAAKYDAPKPLEFDTWTQPVRAEWCEAHRLDKGQDGKVPPVESKLETPSHAEAEAKSIPVVQPPKTPPPPARPVPVPPAMEIDWRLEWMKSRVQAIHRFQMYSNPKLAVPTDWETVWLEEMDTLYKLTEGKEAHLPEMFMFHDVLMLSQVKHPTKYPTPASIAAHIPELAREVLALRISGEFDTLVVDEFFRVVNLDTPKEEELKELELTAEQIERQQAEEIKTNAKRAAAWQKWMEQHETCVCA